MPLGWHRITSSPAPAPLPVRPAPAMPSPASPPLRSVEDAPAARTAPSLGAEDGSEEAPRKGPTAPFSLEQPTRGLASLVVSEAVRSTLSTVIARVRHHETLYNEWGLAQIDPFGKRIVLNLYGPPGTGKSLCAEAMAHELGRRLLRVDHAELESKFVGETPKNIKAAFRCAEEAGAILFFDEADAILSKRLTSVTQSADQSVNSARSTMLTQMDRHNGIVIFATNFFSSYDPAFLRRIFAHVELPLPDEACRVELWGKLLPATLPGAAALDRQQLAVRSQGLAGGDMLEIIKRAASRAVQRAAPDRYLTLEDLSSEIEHLRSVRGAHERRSGAVTTLERVDDPAEVRSVAPGGNG